MPSQNAYAIASGQQLQGIAAQLINVYTQILAYQAAYSADPPAGDWQNMATAAQNADGTLGAADSTPTVTHPITEGSLGMSYNNMVAMVGYCADFVNFFSGASAPTATNRLAIAQDLVE